MLDVLFVFNALATELGKYPISFATFLICSFVSSLMSLCPFSALLTVATETWQAAAISFMDTMSSPLKENMKIT